MSLKDKLFHYCFGGWIVDAIAGLFAAENAKINGHSSSHESDMRTFRCLSQEFCEDMRSVRGEMFCGRKSPDAVLCRFARRADVTGE